MDNIHLNEGNVKKIPLMQFATYLKLFATT